MMKMNFKGMSLPVKKALTGFIATFMFALIVVGFGLADSNIVLADTMEFLPGTIDGNELEYGDTNEYMDGLDGVRKIPNEEWFNPDVHVCDEAGLYNSVQASELNEKCNEFSKEHDVNVVIVTTKWYQDDAVHMARVISDNRDKCTEQGRLVLFIDMYNRAYAIYSWENDSSDNYYISQGHRDKIISDMGSDMSADKYYEATLTFFEKSDKWVGYRLIGQWWFDIIIAVVISAIIVFPTVLAQGGKMTVSQRDYIKNPGTAIEASRDDYIRTTVTRVRRQSSSGGHSGGGGGHGGGSGGHF